MTFKEKFWKNFLCVNFQVILRRPNNCQSFMQMKRHIQIVNNITSITGGIRHNHVINSSLPDITSQNKCYRPNVWLLKETSNAVNFQVILRRQNELSFLHNHVIHVIFSSGRRHPRAPSWASGGRARDEREKSCQKEGAARIVCTGLLPAENRLRLGGGEGGEGYDLRDCTLFAPFRMWNWRGWGEGWRRVPSSVNLLIEAAQVS